MTRASRIVSAACWLAVVAAFCGFDAAAAAKAAGAAQKPCHFLSQCACRDTRSALLVNCRAANVGTRVPLSALKKSVPLFGGAPGGGSGNDTSSVKLLALRMVRSNLSVVQSGAFAGLPVSLVDVSYNHIRQVDEDAFAGATGVAQNLGVLKLNGNRLTELPAAVLRGLDGLRVLEVAHNKLASLGFVCHRPLPRLRLLSARGNAIRRLEGGCWRNYTSLAYVDLANNALSALPPAAFDSLAASLQVVDLSENSLTRLQPRSFAKLRALLELRLSGNRLSSVDFLCHVDLPNLSYAVLSRNRIAAIDRKCWSGGPRRAAAASRALSNGTSVAATADGDESTRTPPRWGRQLLPKLRDLMLSGNKLRNMDALCGAALPSLSRLALDRNYIRHVPRGCFANKTALGSVTLSDNKLSKLDCCLGLEHTAVRHLDVSHNVIRSVSDQFLAGAPRLSSLHLQDNYLNSLEFLCSRSYGVGSDGGSGGVGLEGSSRTAGTKLHVTVDNALRWNIRRECVAEQKGGWLTIETPDALESALLSPTTRSSASPS